MGGFGLGVLFASIKDHWLILDVLDRAFYKNPADYIYLKMMRKKLHNKPSWFQKVLPLKKKPLDPIELDEDKIAQEIEQELNPPIDKQYQEHLDQREQMAKSGRQIL
jgi:hypothetical protein